MARLFIANVTRQRYVVYYRLDAGQTNGLFTAPKQITIEPGRQTPVGGDLDKPQLDTIINQLNVFGMVGEVDVPNNLTGVHELVFNIDRPVSDRALRALVAHNAQVKVAEGDQRRQRAAIGANEALKVATANAEIDPPSEFDLEFEQMEQAADESRIEQGFHVKANLAEVPSDLLHRRRAS